MLVVLLMIFPILLLVPNILYFSGTSGDDSSFAGVWKGDSVCQIKDSPCHDETSVYYVSRGAGPNDFQMKMNKVVEYDADGRNVWEVNSTRPTCVQRLPNGNTLISSRLSPTVTEVNRAGETVWTHEMPVRSRMVKASRR